MLKWGAITAGACIVTAVYGFAGDFTILKGIAQLMSYMLMVIALVLAAITLLRGKGE